MATRQDSPEIRRDTGRQETAERTGMDTEARGERETGLRTTREAPSEQTRRGGLERAVAPTPFASMQRLMEDIDQIVRDFWYGVEGGRSPSASRSGMPALSRNATELWGAGDRGEFGVDLWSPSIEAFERDNTFVVRAELPGVSKDEVTVDITETVLTVEGQRRRETENKGQNFYRSERSYGRFYRLIPLPEGIDPDKADAKFSDGVLEIAMPLPKREERKGRRLSLR